MKKVLAICLIMSCATISFAQTSAYPSSVTVYINLKEKRYDRAKPVIDELCLNVPLKYDPKTNFYKGLIYQGIFDDTTECNYGISKDSALIVSLQAYINSYLFNVEYDDIQVSEKVLYNINDISKQLYETLNDPLRDTLVFLSMCDSLFPDVYSVIEKAQMLNESQKFSFTRAFTIIESHGKNIDRSKVSINYRQFKLPEMFGTYLATEKRPKGYPDSRYLQFCKNYTFWYFVVTDFDYDSVRKRVSGVYVVKGKRIILYPSGKSGKIRLRLKNDMLIQKFLIFNRFRFR